MKSCVKNRFLIEALKKECKLKKLGLNLPILKFTDNGKDIEIVIIGDGKEKKFTISFLGENAYLENKEYQAIGGRPTFYLGDMVTYLFVLANGGQVFGKLMYPGTEEKRLIRIPAVIPT